MSGKYEIEVFRVGPSSRGITTAEVDQAISNYADGQAPLVFGHPKNDDPAHGWVESIRREGAKVFATLRDVSQEAIDKVKAKAFANRSIAFWHPDHSSNPKAGEWGFRHLGLLGAASPGIPGMPALSFSADDTAIEGNEAPEPAVIFAEETTPTVTVTEPKGAPKVELTQEQFDALEAENKRLKDAADARTKADDEARKAANTAFVDKMVTEGRLLPGHKAVFAELFNRLPVDEVQFDADTKGTLGDELKKILAAASPQIVFEALSPTGEKGGGKLDAAQVKARADQLVKDGKAVSFEAAVEMIESKGV
jgi:hypothetical protein